MPDATDQRHLVFEVREGDSGEHTPVYIRHSFDYSLTGLTFCSMLLFMGVAAMNSQANLLFAVFGLMIGILAVSYFIGKLVLKGLVIKRLLPEHATVGRSMAAVYEIHNSKRFWPSLSVTIGEIDGVDAFVRQPQTYLLHAAAKMTATIATELVPRRRGLHELGRAQISTSFPFGFIKRAKQIDIRETLLVYPAVAEIDPRVMQKFLSAESSGPMMRPRRGGMDEFYGLKEHRTGESPRWISWRHSAKTGALVSREMTHVSPPRLLILVDSYSGEGGAIAPADIEKSIAMAASLAGVALEQNIAVGITAWSGEWIVMSPSRGKRHRRDILTLLARLPKNNSEPTQRLMDRSYDLQESGTTLVLFTATRTAIGLGEASRGGLVVFGPHVEGVDRMFRFPPTVDFAHCGPLEEVESNDLI